MGLFLGPLFCSSDMFVHSFASILIAVFLQLVLKLACVSPLFFSLTTVLATMVFFLLLLFFLGVGSVCFLFFVLPLHINFRISLLISTK